jgi:hypothetical protein
MLGSALVRVWSTIGQRGISFYFFDWGAIVKRRLFRWLGAVTIRSNLLKTRHASGT